MARIACIALGLALLTAESAPVRARAAVSTAVKLRVVRLARQGKRAFAARRYAEALRLYRKAYNLWAKPELLYNIALAHDRAGQPVQAMTFLRAFFSETRGKRLRRRLKRGALRLRRRLQPRVAVLGLSGHAGAKAYVNGKLMGTVPLQVVLAPGVHRLVLRAPGRQTVKRSVMLEAGRTTLLELQLPKGLPPRPRPPGGHVPPETPPSPSRGLHMAYALSAAGLAVALASGALATGMLAIQRYDDFQAAPTSASRARVERLRDATNGLWIAAGVVGAGAVVLAIFTRWRARRESASRPAPRVSLAPGPGGLGLAVQGGF